MKRHPLKTLISSGPTGTNKPVALAGTVMLFIAILLLYAGCGIGQEKSASADKSSLQDNAEATQRQALPVPPPHSVTISNGTLLQVRLLEAISSRTAHAGQEFVAELTSPVLVQDNVIFPRSSRVRGRVVSARESGRLQDPGYLRLTLDAVQSPDGKWIDIQTTSVSAEGRSHKKRDWTLIGGGSGLGAMIGGIAGGGKGAAIGAASGAAAGTAGAYATGKRDVTFSAERKLRFLTVETVVLNR